ncbi:ATP-binding cassette domain-containing protein [Burkholderia multivorans]|nr:ATP-binding cassette domain-containing protein [Burkholderia multivorans]MDN7862114.1 ATP-binding cassette domain-containing protein [Burkholderia multivorans]
MERVGVGSYEKLLPSELSGGMQQRVGLACALAVNPSVLLMDGAFCGLDPLFRFEMQNELLQLQKKEQRTIVFISVDIEEAVKIGAHIGIMKDGCLIQVGTPAELIYTPADAHVQEFFRNVDVSRFLKASSMMTQVERGLLRCDAGTPSDRYLNQLIGSGAESASHDRRPIEEVHIVGLIHWRLSSNPSRPRSTKGKRVGRSQVST